MAIDSCGICGGDGRIQNSFGNETRCPSCHGTGRRSDEGGMRDVTKTKASHHRVAAPKVAVEKGPGGPTTSAGMKLAEEVLASGISNDTKTKLVREIAEYESTHGKCTDTFTKKVKKQIRPLAIR
jgi:RecJ-like exonuclease